MSRVEEPFLIENIRRHTRGEVIHDPKEGHGRLGTSAVGFLREYEAAIAAAWATGYQAGIDHYQELSHWGAVVRPYAYGEERPRTPQNPYPKGASS